MVGEIVDWMNNTRNQIWSLMKLHLMNREKFVHLEFIFLFVVTVDPGVLVGRILVLVVAVFPQHPQPPFLLVLQMFKWKQFQHHCNYINATNMPQASILIKSSSKCCLFYHYRRCHFRHHHLHEGCPPYQFQGAGILLRLIFHFLLH